MTVGGNVVSYFREGSIFDSLMAFGDFLKP